MVLTARYRFRNGILNLATGISLLLLPFFSTDAGSRSQLTLAAEWDRAALLGARDSKLGAPVVSRALAIVNTCMYDAWAAYDERAVEMDGSEWIPYQLPTSPTSPFPEYVSGHSTYSAAAARILALWTPSDRFDYEVTLPAGSSKIEPGLTPAPPITLHSETFTEAADEAWRNAISCFEGKSSVPSPH